MPVKTKTYYWLQEGLFLAKNLKTRVKSVDACNSSFN